MTQDDPVAALRPLQDGDADAITALFNQPNVIRGTLRVPFTNAFGVQNWLGTMGPDKHMVVAEADGRAIGFVVIDRFDGRMSHCAELFLSVHDAYQRRGIGRMLLAAAIDIADNWMGLVRLQLEVLCNNAGAIALYRAMGFVEEGRCRAGTLCDGELVDHFVMARITLPPQRRAADLEEHP